MEPYLLSVDLLLVLMSVSVLGMHRIVVSDYSAEYE